MRSTKAILPAALAMVTIACSPQESLNPLCTNDKAVADPALTGLWQTDGADSLDIRGMWQGLAKAEADGDPSQSVPPEYRTYTLVYAEGQNRRAWTFDGRLVHLGEETFLDISPREAPVDSDFRYFPVMLTKDDELPQYTRLSEMFFMGLVPSKSEENGLASGDSSELKLIAAHTFLKVTLEDNRLRAAWLDREWLASMVRNGRISIEHQKVGDDLLLTASPSALQDLLQQISNEPNAFKVFGEWRRKR